MDVSQPSRRKDRLNGSLSLSASPSDELFCCHFKLKSTCFDCKLTGAISDDQLLLYNGGDRQLTPRRRNTSSSTSGDGIVRKWPIDDDVAQFYNPDDTSTDSGIISDFVLIQGDEKFESERFDTPNTSFPMAEVAEEMFEETATESQAEHNDDDKAGAEVWRQRRLENNNKNNSKSMDALTEWTMSILVGTVLLARLFDVSLEIGASLSAIITYLVKTQAARFIKK